MHFYQYTNTIEWNILDKIFYKYFNMNIEKIKILENKFQTIQNFQVPNILDNSISWFKDISSFKASHLLVVSTLLSLFELIQALSKREIGTVFRRQCFHLWIFIDTYTFYVLKTITIIHQLSTRVNSILKAIKSNDNNSFYLWKSWLFCAWRASK